MNVMFFRLKCSLVTPTQRNAALIASMSNAGQVPPKRGRGRPRKHPLPDPPLPRDIYSGHFSHPGAEGKLSRI